jgi:hypothetical protein
MDQHVREAKRSGKQFKLSAMLLSELRLMEKRTRIRTEWMSGDIIEKFFDYVPFGYK